MINSAKAIIFDLDGVLIDSGEANYQAFAYGIEKLGLPRPERIAVIDLVGLKASKMLEFLGCPQHETHRVFTEFVQPYYLDNLFKFIRAMPDADQVLCELKARNYQIFACTSGGRVIQTQVLKSIGLWRYIDKMQTPDDSDFAKPDPRYLQELFTDCRPDTLFHVEDSEVGILMGNACGATTIFSEYGYGNLPLDLKVDHKIGALRELLKIVK
ncbi:MAG: HAD family hydrolase [Cyanobacteria bacterium P01_G01_bin.54]